VVVMCVWPVDLSSLLMTYYVILTYFFLMSPIGFPDLGSEILIEQKKQSVSNVYHLSAGCTYFVSFLLWVSEWMSNCVMAILHDMYVSIFIAFYVLHTLHYFHHTPPCAIFLFFYNPPFLVSHFSLTCSIFAFCAMFVQLNFSLPFFSEC
jgi:hypothetical protein